MAGTADVRAMYEALPFPNTPYTVSAFAFASYFARQARRGSRSLFAEGVDVLDAGCGTGGFIASLAPAYPESRFLGVDMTEASLALARSRASVPNLVYQRANLLELDLDRRFDVIICMGVLHHLEDMDRGLARLAAHLVPDGVLVLWLYGRHGRQRLHLNQRMLALLAGPDEPLATRLDVARRALTGLRDADVACRFSVADQKLMNDFPAARAWILGHDAWLADQFLHPIEHPVDIDVILGLLGRHGLALDQWLGVGDDPGRHTQDPALAERLRALAPVARLRFLDLLLKPDDYLVAARLSTT